MRKLLVSLLVLVFFAACKGPEKKSESDFDLVEDTDLTSDSANDDDEATDDETDSIVFPDEVDESSDIDELTDSNEPVDTDEIEDIDETEDADIPVCECNAAGPCCDGCNFMPPNTDCSDENFCNGEEKCDNSGVCSAPVSPCMESGCNETLDECCETGMYGENCDQCVIFVKPGGLPDIDVTENRGKSWTNAFSSIKTGINLAETVITDDNSIDSCQVWVAYETLTFNDLDSGIIIPENVSIFGGFAGTEADISDRPLGENTIFDGSVSSEKFDEYGYVFSLNSNSSLDSFAFTNIISKNLDFSYSSCNSAPVLIEDAENTVVSNCQFYDNMFYTDANGLCIVNSETHITDCEHFNNYSAHGYDFAFIGSASASIERLKLSSNTGWSGGGVFSYTFGGNISTESSVIANNSKMNRAAFQINSFSSANASITNTTITGNQNGKCESQEVAGLSVWGFNNISNSLVALNKCENKASNFKTQKSTYSETTFIQTALELSEWETSADYSDYSGLIFVDESSTLFSNIHLAGTWSSDAIYDSLTDTTTFTDSSGTWIAGDIISSDEATVFIMDMGPFCQIPVISGAKVYVGCMELAGDRNNVSQVCNSLSGSAKIAVISSESENSIIASMASENVFLGNEKINDGTWAYYDEPSSYTNWATGEPAVNEIFTIARMYGSGESEPGKWYSLPQDSTVPGSVVCEIDLINFVPSIFARRIVSATDTTITISGKYDEMNASGAAYSLTYLSFMPVSGSVLIDSGNDTVSSEFDYFGNEWTDTPDTGTEGTKSDIGAVDHRP